MAEDAILRFTLAVVIGTLAAIVYCLRILVLMDRRVARIEKHIERMIGKVMKEEQKQTRMLRTKRYVKKKK